MSDQTNQQNDQIDGLLLNLVKKGLSWVEDCLHAQQHVCINLNNANPIEILNDGPYLTNKRLNVEYETIKKDLMKIASITLPDNFSLSEITPLLQKNTIYDYFFHGNDILDIFPFGVSNAVIYFITTHYKLNEDKNWTSDGFKDALFDLTRYFEILVYYDYYYTFTCMDVSKYEYDEKKVQADKIFNKPLTQQVKDENHHYLLQVAFRQHYLIFKLFYEQCQSIKIGYQTILPIENYRVNIPAVSLKVGTEQDVITLTYTDSRYRSHNQIYNIYKLLTTFNRYSQEKDILKMKNTEDLKDIDICFSKLSLYQQQLLYNNIIDVKPQLTTMHDIFIKKFNVQKDCEAAMKALVRYVYPNNSMSKEDIANENRPKEHIPGIKYIVSRLLNIQFIYHLDVILEQICKYVDKSSLAVYYYLTLLEREKPKKNESKYIEILYGKIFNEVLNSKPISQYVVDLRQQIRMEMQLLNDVYDQLLGMYYKPTLDKHKQIRLIDDRDIDFNVNKFINELNFEKVKEYAEKTDNLYNLQGEPLEKKVISVLGVNRPEFFVKDDKDKFNGISQYKTAINTILQNNEYLDYKETISIYIKQRVEYCQKRIFPNQDLNPDVKVKLCAIVFEIYIGLLPSYINHAAHRTTTQNLSDEILNQTVIQVMLDNLEEPTQNTSPNINDVDELLYKVKTYVKIYPQRCQQFYTLMFNKIKYCFESIKSIDDIQLPVGYDLLNQFYNEEEPYNTLQIYKKIYNSGSGNVINFQNYCKNPDGYIQPENQKIKVVIEFERQWCNYINWYRILDKFSFRETNGIVKPNIIGIKNFFIKAKQLKLENLDVDIKNVFLDGCHITDDGVRQIYQLIFEVENQLEIDQGVIARQFGIDVSLLDKAQTWISAYEKNQSQNNTQ